MCTYNTWEYSFTTCQCDSDIFFPIGETCSYYYVLWSKNMEWLLGNKNGLDTWPNLTLILTYFIFHLNTQLQIISWWFCMLHDLHKIRNYEIHTSELLKNESQKMTDYFGHFLNASRACSKACHSDARAVNLSPLQCEFWYMIPNLYIDSLWILNSICSIIISYVQHMFLTIVFIIFFMFVCLT